MNLLEVFITLFELLIISLIYTKEIPAITSFPINQKQIQYNFSLISIQSNERNQHHQNTSGIFDYDTISSFSLRDNFHKPYSFNKKGLCIVLMSSNRPQYMVEDLTLLLYYIQKYEPSLKYDLIWIDTATKNFSYLYPKLDERFHFDKILHLPTFSTDKQYEGIPRIYEHAVHLCEKNDYFMPFEEDFKLINTPKIGFIQNTIDILNNSPHSLMGLVYRNDVVKKGPQKTLLIQVRSQTFNISCQLNREYQFNNGASIYRMTNIKELIQKGINRNPLYELSMSRSARELGMFYGLVDFDDNCTKPIGSCHGIFLHIGKISSRTSK